MPGFRIVFLSIYAAVNLYILFRLLPLLPARRGVRIVFSVLLGLSVIALPAARFGRAAVPGWINQPLSWAGGWWLGLAFHLFLIIVLIDAGFFLARIVRKCSGRQSPRLSPAGIGRLSEFIPGARNPRVIPPNNPSSQRGAIRRRLYLSGVALAVITLLGGHLNSYSIRRRDLHLRIEKKGIPLESLKIVFVSDLHLGRLTHRGFVEKIVKMIKALEPDLVLMGGDIADGGGWDGGWEKANALLRTLDPPLGVFAVMGNHEYYAGGEASAAHIKEAGVRLLRDEAIQLADGITLVGREDPTTQWLGSGPRKHFSDLLAPIPEENLVIVFEHQPVKTNQLEGTNVDLYLAGHTHHGQLFPLNLIASAIYDTSWGYRQAGPTHIYVSSGAGNAVAPVRTASYPEIVFITLDLDSKRGTGGTAPGE